MAPTTHTEHRTGHCALCDRKAPTDWPAFAKTLDEGHAVILANCILAGWDIEPDRLLCPTCGSDPFGLRDYPPLIRFTPRYLPLALVASFPSPAKKRNADRNIPTCTYYSAAVQ